ncbi:MAG: sigma-70 family RNA polymerase sigma factor [Actinomycetota bacterium]
MAVVEGTRRPDVGAATHDLYRQYGKQIYAYCYHRLRSREEAEDAVQTTFMNAFRALQRGVQTQFEQAWLFKIAQNVCIARSSSSARRLRLEAPNDFEVLQEIVPSQEGERPIELIGVEEALEAMPENQRRAILLREWQGLSYREIGEELGLSQAAVEMLIFRARRALAGALEQPDPTKQKKFSRRVGSAGSLLGALKTLLGGGTAIKAVAVAAAGAIAVVGESAQHTIVRHMTSAPRAHATDRPRAAASPLSLAVAAPSREEPSRPTARPQVVLREHVQAHPPASVAARPDVGDEPAPAATTTVAAPAPEPPVTTASAPAPAPAPVPQPPATADEHTTATTTTTQSEAAAAAPAPAASTSSTTTTTPTTTTPPTTTTTTPVHSGAGSNHTAPTEEPSTTQTTTTTIAPPLTTRVIGGSPVPPPIDSGHTGQTAP